MRSFIILAFLIVGFASAVGAYEGVVEINQAAALQGGVSPDDPPGFPVVLTRSGSYRLTGNLDAPISAGGIFILAPFVTLDLGGFTLSSTNGCSGYPTTNCASTTGNPGIFGGEKMAVVRNGFVRGFAGDCVLLQGDSSQVETVIAFGCGGRGIAAESVGGRVMNSSAVQNLTRGIVIANGGTAESNESRGNGNQGLFVTGSRLVARLVANRILDNGGVGISSNSAFQPVASKNFLASNAGGTFTLIVSLGDNLCLNAFC